MWEKVRLFLKFCFDYEITYILTFFFVDTSQKCPLLNLLVKSSISSRLTGIIIVVNNFMVVTPEWTQVGSCSLEHPPDCTQVCKSESKWTQVQQIYIHVKPGVVMSNLCLPKSKKSNAPYSKILSISSKTIPSESRYSLFHEVPVEVNQGHQIVMKNALFWPTSHAAAE